MAKPTSVRKALSRGQVARKDWNIYEKTEGDPTTGLAFSHWGSRYVVDGTRVSKPTGISTTVTITSLMGLR